MPDNGTLKVGPSVTPGYFAQQQGSLDATQTPVELVRRLKPLDYQQAVATLALYGFDRDSAETPIGDLSGGERSRLQLASLILTGANFLLLDEPTNNLDTASVEELEAALLDLEGTILTISHDRYYLNRVCTRVVEFREGKVLDHSGGYAAFRDSPELGAPLTRSVREQLAAPPVSERKRRRVR